MKLHVLCILIAFCAIDFSGVYAQSANNEIKSEQQTARISSSVKGDIVQYSFVPLSDYNEANANQYVGRIRTITDSNIEIRHVGNKIEISLDPEKVKGYDLDNLLRGIAVLHGYSGYEVN